MNLILIKLELLLIQNLLCIKFYLKFLIKQTLNECLKIEIEILKWDFVIILIS